MTTKLPMTEIFPAVQGEGPEAGTPTVFIRTYGCDIYPKCNFCDTPWSWSKGGRGEMDLNDILAEAKRYKINHFTITGGEPAMYPEELKKLRQMKPSIPFSVETNGVRNVGDFYDTVVISPKKQDVNIETLTEYSSRPNTYFKFVFEGILDRWWEKVINQAHIPKDRVYIMPEGKTRVEQIERMPRVIGYCMNEGYKFSPRIHVLAFDTQMLK